MVVNDYVASLSMRPGGQRRVGGFLPGSPKDCLIQDEASQMVQPSVSMGTKMEGLGPACLEGMLKKCHR